MIRLNSEKGGGGGPRQVQLQRARPPIQRRLLHRGEGQPDFH